MTVHAVSKKIASTLTGNDWRRRDVICLFACRPFFFFFCVLAWLVCFWAEEDSQPVLHLSIRWCHDRGAGVRIPEQGGPKCSTARVWPQQAVILHRFSLLYHHHYLCAYSCSLCCGCQQLNCCRGHSSLKYCLWLGLSQWASITSSQFTDQDVCNDRFPLWAGQVHWGMHDILN